MSCFLLLSPLHDSYLNPFLCFKNSRWQTSAITNRSLQPNGIVYLCCGCQKSSSVLSFQSNRWCTDVIMSYQMSKHSTPNREDLPTNCFITSLLGPITHPARPSRNKRSTPDEERHQRNLFREMILLWQQSLPDRCNVTAKLTSFS